ncbi:MAG: hypothetical protein K2Y35_06465 [Burkholderiales bacterium]|nr:hypothetical protein [Burkholderiales bacterium]
MLRIGLAAIAVVALLGACGREEPATPQAASSSDDRVKNADKLMLPAREGAKTINAADKVDDVYKAQKEATDKQVEESTK